MNNATLADQKTNILKSFLSKQNVVAFTVLCLGSLIIGLINKHVKYEPDVYASFSSSTIVSDSYDRENKDNQENLWRQRHDKSEEEGKKLVASYMAVSEAGDEFSDMDIKIDEAYCPPEVCFSEVDKSRARAETIKIEAIVESLSRLIGKAEKAIEESIGSTGAAATQKKGLIEVYLKDLAKKKKVLNETWAKKELKDGLDKVIAEITNAEKEIHEYSKARKKLENTLSIKDGVLNSAVNAFSFERPDDQIVLRFRRLAYVIEVEEKAKAALGKLVNDNSIVERTVAKIQTTADMSPKDVVRLALKKIKGIDTLSQKMEDDILSALGLEAPRKAAVKALVNMKVFDEAGAKSAVSDVDTYDKDAEEIVTAVMKSKLGKDKLDRITENNINKTLGICKSSACAPLEPEEGDPVYVVMNEIAFSSYDDIFSSNRDKLKEFKLYSDEKVPTDVLVRGVLSDLGYEGDEVDQLMVNRSGTVSELQMIREVLIDLKTADLPEEEKASFGLEDETEAQIRALIASKKAFKPFANMKAPGETDKVEILKTVSRAKITTDWIKIWLELTLAGLAMGFLLFLMSSGMTLVFGLMGVFNLAHGAFIALGAYIGWKTITAIESATIVTETVMRSPMPGLIPPKATEVMVENGLFYSPGVGSTIVALMAGLLITCVVAGVCGYVFERVIVRPVYTNALKQILITMGGSIVIVELILVFFHSEQAFPKPDIIGGQLIFLKAWGGGIGIDKARIFAGVVGIVLFIATVLLLNKTKIGLLIRAGVESKEMVEVMGYRIRLIFIMVFVAAIIMAAIGGVIYGLNIDAVGPEMANDLLIMVIVAIIIGGMGSVKGCLIGALLITLTNNYMSGIVPQMAGEASTVLLMVVILMWRPQGLNPITSH